MTKVSRQFVEFTCDRCGRKASDEVPGSLEGWIKLSQETAGGGSIVGGAGVGHLCQPCHRALKAWWGAARAYAAAESLPAEACHA